MLHREVAVIIGVGWIGLIAYWLVSASKSKHNVKTTYRKFALFRFVIFFLLLIFIELTGKNHRYNYSGFYLKSEVAQISGLVLFLCGIFVSIWARINIATNWGMPMSIKEKPELVTSGPYKYIRHPIYSAFLLSMAGTALAISLYWTVILVSVGSYFIYSAVQEEHYLGGQFGKQYTVYKKKTKMLIPFIF